MMKTFDILRFDYFGYQNSREKDTMSGWKDKKMMWQFIGLLLCQKWRGSTQTKPYIFSKMLNYSLYTPTLFTVGKLDWIDESCECFCLFVTEI